MRLLEKQKIFTLLVAKLIYKADELGYGITFGEAYRPPETAKLYAEQGRGIAGSLHTQRCAIDLCLFKDGYYLTQSEDYKEMGEWWVAQSTEDYTCRWGGAWEDGNHFSIAVGDLG